MMRRGMVAALIIAGLAAAALVVLAGCGGNTGLGTQNPGQKPSTQGSLSTTDQPGKPTEEQTGAPFYPGSVYDVGMEDSWRFHTSDSFDQVVAFYKSNLPGAEGYETKAPTGRSMGFSYNKGEHSYDVSIQENFPQKGYVEVVISVAR